MPTHKVGSMNKPAAPLHIFFAGTHTATDGTSHTFSEADVADMVASYEPSLCDAPLVVGHPKLDDPAYGSVASLSTDGGHVYATPREVEPQFAELVNTGRFPKISASIYLPNTPGNPKPGHHYLRHVGFLGAAAPSLKGLQRPTLNFAANDGALEFALPLPRRLTSVGFYLKRLFQGLRDKAIETDGADKAEQLIPQWCIDGIAEATTDDDTTPAMFAETPPTTETPMSQTPNAADFAAQQTQMDAQKAQLEQRENALKQREDAAKRDDAASFAEALVADGKLLPRQQARVVELLLALPAGTVLNFAEADGQAATAHDAADTLRGLLSDLPVHVNFAEKSAGHDNSTAASADFAAPAGTRVDAARMDLHSKALAYQRLHPGTDIIAAAKAVGG